MFTSLPSLTCSYDVGMLDEHAEVSSMSTSYEHVRKGREFWPFSILDTCQALVMSAWSELQDVVDLLSRSRSRCQVSSEELYL